MDRHARLMVDRWKQIVDTRHQQDVLNDSEAGGESSGSTIARPSPGSLSIHRRRARSDQRAGADNRAQGLCILAKSGDVRLLSHKRSACICLSWSLLRSYSSRFEPHGRLKKKHDHEVHQIVQSTL